MPDSIVALLSDERSVPHILDAAERLAGFTGRSRIDALVMRLDARGAALITHDKVGQFCDETLQENEEKIRIQEVERSRGLRLRFDEWVSLNRGISVSWIDQEGKSEIVFATLRDQLEYVVVARPDTSASLAEHEAMLAAVFASGCPVLIMPPQARVDFGGSIAIAWQDHQDTFQIATDAFRLFPNAKEVHLLIGSCPGTPVPSNLKVPVHDSATVSQHILNIKEDESLGKAILTAARLVNADLLVSGATSHNTWHILLFGEVTKVLLHQSEMPLLVYCKDNALNAQ